MEKSSNGLDIMLCNKFIDLHHKYQKISIELFNNTKYFTTEYIIESLRELIIQWNHSRDNTRKLYILLMSNKFGSEKWIYNMFKDIFPNHDIIKDSLSQKIEEHSEIVFIDDWCLSGNNAMSKIDDVIYDLKKIYNTKPNDIKCTVIASIMTDDARKRIFRIYKDTIFYYKSSVCIFQKPENVSVELFEEFLCKFQPDTGCSAYPIHLEYKIANSFGSFPNIYKECRNKYTKPY